MAVTNIKIKETILLVFVSVTWRMDTYQNDLSIHIYIYISTIHIYNICIVDTQFGKYYIYINYKPNIEAVTSQTNVLKQKL